MWWDCQQPTLGGDFRMTSRVANPLRAAIDDFWGGRFIPGCSGFMQSFVKSRCFPNLWVALFFQKELHRHWNRVSGALAMVRLTFPGLEGAVSHQQEAGASIKGLDVARRATLVSPWCTVKFDLGRMGLPLGPLTRPTRLHVALR
jgi:hypothetical protein